MVELSLNTMKSVTYCFQKHFIPFLLGILVAFKAFPRYFKALHTELVWKLTRSSSEIKKRIRNQESHSYEFSTNFLIERKKKS